MCITTNQPDTKSIPNPNPNPNPTTKQHAIVNIQLNIVTFPMYPDKFIRDMLLHRLHNFKFWLSHCHISHAVLRLSTQEAAQTAAVHDIHGVPQRSIYISVDSTCPGWKQMTNINAQRWAVTSGRSDTAVYIHAVTQWHGHGSAHQTGSVFFSKTRFEHFLSWKPLSATPGEQDQQILPLI